MKPVCSVRAAGLISAGATLFDIPVQLGGLEVGVGCPRLNLGSVRLTPGLSSDLLMGHTQYGLQYSSFAFGPELDLSFGAVDRLHLGVRIEALYTKVSDIPFIGIGATVRVAFDLIRFDDFRSIWLGGGLKIDAPLLQGASVVPLLQAGIRI